MSYAAMISLRLSSRVTVPWKDDVLACPYRAKVRQTQPRLPSSRARARYWVWLPAQPCTKRTPGANRDGDTMVPAIRRSATAISTSCSWIGMADSVFDHRAAALVDPAKIDDCIARRVVRITVALDRCGADHCKLRIVFERRERQQFGRSGSADSPGLVQNA